MNTCNNKYPPIRKIHILALHPNVEVQYNAIDNSVLSVRQRGATVTAWRPDNRTPGNMPADKFEELMTYLRCHRRLLQVNPDEQEDHSKSLCHKSVFWTHKVFRVGATDYVVVESIPKRGVLTSGSMIHTQDYEVDFLKVMQVLMLLDEPPCCTPLPLPRSQAVFAGDVLCGRESFTDNIRLVAPNEVARISGSITSYDELSRFQTTVVRSGEDCSASSPINASVDRRSDEFRIINQTGRPIEDMPLTADGGLHNAETLNDIRPLESSLGNVQIGSVIAEDELNKLPTDSAYCSVTSENDQLYSASSSHFQVLGVCPASSESGLDETQPSLETNSSLYNAEDKQTKSSSSKVSPIISSPNDTQSADPTVCRIFPDVWGTYTQSQLNDIFRSCVLPYLDAHKPCISYPGKRFSEKGHRFIIWAAEPVGPGIYNPGSTYLFFSRDPVGEFRRIHISPLSDTLPVTYEYDIYDDYLQPFVTARPFRVYGEGDSFRYKGVQFKVLRTDPNTRSLDDHVERFAEDVEHLIETRSSDDRGHVVDARMATSSNSQPKTFRRLGSSVLGIGIVTRMRIGWRTEIYCAGSVKPTLQDIVGVEATNRIRLTPSRYLHYQIQVALGELFPDEYERVINLQPSDNLSRKIKRALDRNKNVKELIMKQCTVTMSTLSLHPNRHLFKKLLNNVEQKRQFQSGKEVSRLTGIDGNMLIGKGVKSVDTSASTIRECNYNGDLEAVISNDCIEDAVTNRGDVASVMTMKSNDSSDVIGDHSDVDLPCCAVCLSEFTADDSVLELPCIHLFHVSCVQYWLDRSTTCPLCKRNVMQFIAWENVSAETRHSILDDDSDEMDQIFDDNDALNNRGDDRELSSHFNVLPAIRRAAGRFAMAVGLTNQRRVTAVPQTSFFSAASTVERDGSVDC